jgi:hypothetical protein
MVYNCGIKINAIQHVELRAFAKTAGDNGKYVVALLQIIFGIEVNVTTTQLCEEKLKLIKRELKIFIFCINYPSKKNDDKISLNTAVII